MNTDVPTPVPDASVHSATPAATPLPNDLAVLHNMIRELLDTLHKTQRERDGLRERIDLLVHKLYGKKSERFDPNQPFLFPDLNDSSSASPSDSSASLAPDQLPAEPNPEPSAAKPKRKGHGRKLLPENLRRERIVHELPEAERLCPCCGGVQQKFGEEISEQLDYIPASFFVNQHVRCKYACPKCHEGVAIAEAPPQPIDKGIPGPGLLAQIAVSKYADHIPLHRFERIALRHQVELARSTMCVWMRDLADLFRPAIDLMQSLVLQSKALHTDATNMPYQDLAAPGKISSGQMWTVIGDKGHAFNLFRFSSNHSGGLIKDTLATYEGFLSADAHNIYDSLFRKIGRAGDPAILEVGCWAHCRRNFYDARGNDAPRAHEALARIRRLYAIEAEAKEIIAERKLQGPDADAVVLALRQDKSRLDAAAIRQWLEREAPLVLPKSLIGQAIQYALNHWLALTRFLDHGFLAIDNNVSENALRAIALGRKNWLFAGNLQGGHTAATMFSLTSSCRRHRVDEFAYLRQLTIHLSGTPHPDAATLRDWLPDRWQPQPAPANTGIPPP